MEPISEGSTELYSDHIRVGVRVRPLDSSRGTHGLNVDAVHGKISHGKHNFRFAQVFEGGEDNASLFEKVGKPLVSSALMGYNGTLMTYGQTGSGKTYTIGEVAQMGTANEGVAHRMVRDVFREVRRDRSYDYEIGVQYVQIHLEKIFDLLNDKGYEHGRQVVEPLQLREGADGVYVQGATTEVAAHPSRGSPE